MEPSPCRPASPRPAAHHLLLCGDAADTLSVESLTLVPPVDHHSLHALTGIPPPPSPATVATEAGLGEAGQPEPADPAGA